MKGERADTDKVSMLRQKQITTGDHALWRERVKEEERNQLCLDILANARRELFVSVRYMDVAFLALPPGENGAIQQAGTDGEVFWYCTADVLRLYQSGRRVLNRLYLHTLMHCIFCHMYQRKEREEELWNLACDIAVEGILDRMYLRCIHIPQSALRREVYRKLEQRYQTWTAQRIYQFLMELLENGGADYLERLKAEFTRDDHRYWEAAGKSGAMEQQKRWEDVRKKMETEMEIFSREASDDRKSLEDSIRFENRQRYDYREFLKRFSVFREEMKVDMDSFDYIFYNYGMELYHNMPLIEPLESREVQKIEEFVIVIDTSMSCRRELVEKFLQETWNILMNSESFFRQIQLHIIQCDDRIQEDVVITCQEDMEHYREKFQIKGLGGTDFRPAFAYVEELMAKKCFHHLRGMIYFTDGYGVFPVKKPVFDTAFVFMQEDYRDVDVPPWAIKLILEPEELKRGEND